MNRGEVWWASLPAAQGSAPGYRRPVLVIQSDAFNESAINTVVIATLTTNLDVGNAPGNVHVSASQSGLPKDSIINVSQILTVDKRMLTEFVETLPARVLKRVDNGLRLVLDI